MTATTGADAAAPLGVYIHWPYCARICPYCDFNVVRARGRVEEATALTSAIATDLRSHAARIGPRHLVSIFLGGGTPSLMAPDDVGDLVALVRSLWPDEAAPEVTLEANPTDAESGRFEAFAAAGVSRLSLGVQAFDDAALAFLGRNHDAAQAGRAAAIAVRAFPRLSLDLISALPEQTVADWTRTLERAAALGAEHISAYQLSIEPGAAFHRAVRRGRFQPLDDERAADLYETTQTVLTRLGYDAYEVSNHARTPAARARHNLVYWRGEDYVGVGPGAHGRITVEGRRMATEARPRIADYIACVADTGRGWPVAETLAPDAKLEERLLMGLRLAEGAPLAELAGLDLEPARVLAQAGYLRIADGRMAATARGRLVLDRLAAELLA